MRIQIYSAELGEGVTLVRQASRNGETFVGLRIWLKSSKELLDRSTPEDDARSAEDDARSAVTFWARTEDELLELIGEMDRAFDKTSGT